MATIIRPELSEKNEYWVERHRYYELKHFCMQYPFWKKEYNDIEVLSAQAMDSVKHSKATWPSDPVLKLVQDKVALSEKIDLIERIAKKTDPELDIYILKAVTEGLSYNHLKAKLDIPCGRDMYYDRYRRFFWLLDKARN